MPTPGPLYEDDFSDPLSLWSELRGDWGQIGYADGAYEIEIAESGSTVWGTSQGFLSILDDVAIEVTVVQQDGTPEAVSGVVCRGVRDFTWYELGFTRAGAAYIVALREEEADVLAHAEIDPLPLRRATRLRAVCEGGAAGSPIHLSLELDGELVAEAELEDGFVVGQIGLTASHTGPAVFHFDDFRVTRP